MWVAVTSRDADGYTGELTSVPSVITTIRQGDTIRFGPEHVISTRGDRPRWLYREEPDNDQDSGWRALVGDESDKELSAASGILLQARGFVLDRWSELRPVFRTDPENGSWESCTGPGIGQSCSPARFDGPAATVEARAAC